MTDFVWPPENTEPTPEMPYYRSETYSADPLAVSKEGNVYGHERAVVCDPKPWWWTGDRWIEIPNGKGTIIPTGQVIAVADLPDGPRPYREIWQVRFYNAETNESDWVEYHWDVEDEEWKPLNWLWPVDTRSALPTPGHFVGEAHWVMNWHQKYRWVGTGWQRGRHSELDDDEPQRHLPVGFIDLLRPDLELVFVSPKQIAIEATEGGSGKIWIDREWVSPGADAVVNNTDPSIQLVAGGLQTEDLLPDTEYWIYLSNSEFPYVDRRRKLFFSLTAPENGFLSRTGIGRTAKIVGKI